MSVDNKLDKRFEVSNGSIEFLKWIALLFMTIDHANRFFMLPPNQLAYCLGRIAMPLFSFVFAYNIARPEFRFPDHYIISFKRLLFFGLLAIPPYMQMLHTEQIIPLNIMFTLMCSLGTFYTAQGNNSSRIISVSLFLFGSYFVEYNWGGVLLSISFWWWCKGRYNIAIISGSVAFFGLFILNGNNWALVALPIIILFSQVTISCPRIRYLFWIYYPAHLWLFLGIKSFLYYLN